MGCSSSKSQQALEPAVIGQPQTLLSQPEEPKASEAVVVEQAAAETKVLSQPEEPTTSDAAVVEQAVTETSQKIAKVTVLGLRGLPTSDGPGKSEVFVEATIVGKPGSAARTLLAASSSDDAEANSTQAVFETELELKEYVLGDALMLVVTGKDTSAGEVLGRAVLSEEQLRSGFDGELALTTDAASEGPAFLRVKVEARESVAKEILDIVVEVVLATLETVERLLWCRGETSTALSQQEDHF